MSAFDNRNMNRTRMRFWYWELPTIVAASQCPAVLHSVRAASMLHYGVLSKDISVQTEACQWYAKGLNSQRRSLELGSSKTRAVMPRDEDVLSPVMLALFELVAVTIPLGWIQHILAATNMLIMRGPENCQSGLVHMLFRTMRMTVVSKHLETILSLLISYLSLCNNCNRRAACLRNGSLDHCSFCLTPKDY